MCCSNPQMRCKPGSRFWFAALVALSVFIAPWQPARAEGDAKSTCLKQVASAESKALKAELNSEQFTAVVEFLEDARTKCESDDPEGAQQSISLAVKKIVEVKK